MSVRVETRGAIYTVILDRPERKNAVDRETAEALADARPRIPGRRTCAQHRGY